MDALELLKKMITVNTVNPPGNERALAVLLFELLEKNGFTCQLQELGNGRANLIAEFSAGPGLELMLNGHLDVVPAPGPWSHDPFDPVAREGRIYGRGACDMKGGIAAMCTAAIRTVHRGGPKSGRLKLLFVADEECSNLGIRRYLSDDPGGDYAIIGEPTDMEIAAAHRGVSRDYIDIFGPARHAALPQGEGVSAIEKSAEAIEAIQKLNQKLEEYKHPLLPSPGIAITMLKGYEKDNVVPGQVRMLTDFRILPGMSQAEAEAFLKQGLCQAGIEETQITSHFFMPGGELPLSDPFLKQMLEIRERISGRKHKAQAFDASCEQCFLTEAGIKTVICGPGSLLQAHTVDEYLEIGQLETAVEFYEAAIAAILGTETLKKWFKRENNSMNTDLKRLPTPAVVVDLDQAERNIKKMAEEAGKYGIRHRPHIKTHRSGYLAELQIKAGCCGITAAKLGEAEVMADCGIKDIFIAYPIIGEDKIRRLLDLDDRVNVSTIINSVKGAEALSQAFEKKGKQLTVLIEIDGGLNRGGVKPMEPALDFAMKVKDLKGLKIRGLMYYGGLIYDGRTEEDIKESCKKERDELVNTAELLKKHGFSMEILSAGSSFSGKFPELLEGITEIRSGHYIFNDCGQLDVGLAKPEECALIVTSTVIAKPDNQVVICDVGTKSLTSDTCHHRPGYGYILEYPDLEIYSLNEEHAFVRSSGKNPLEIGDKISIIPNHACVVTNLAENVYGFRNGKLDRMISIDARGKSV